MCRGAPFIWHAGTLSLNCTKVFFLNLNEKKNKQAGAEQCQGQHQLWKMLLEELDLDQFECLSLHKH